MTFQWVLDSIPVFLLEFWKTLINLLPYLAAGVLLSELLKFTSWAKIVYKWVSKSPFLAVTAASIIGTVSPLCTYGTMPLVMELYKSGVHIAPLITFLAASSLMNPQLFIMTAGGIENTGLEIAIVLTASVIIISIVLGLLIYLFPKKYIIKKSIKLYENGEFNIENKEKKLFIFKQYLINCLKSFKTISIYMLIGIFLGVFIELYLPKYLILDALGADKGIRAILLASVLGIPLYACGGGAIPFVNRLIQNGMGKGAGLAFFIVGSATRPAPLAAMAAMFTPIFLVFYCIFLIVSSVLIGMLYF